MSRFTAAIAAALILAIAAPAPAHAFDNGRAPASALARIYHPNAQLHVYLRKDAAAAFNTMVLYAAERHGQAPYVLGPLSAYRDYAGQVLLRQQWCAVGKCANAAVPGTSNHGLGLAIDLAAPATMRPWIDAHGRRFGWCKCWSDAPWETWHIRYRPGAWHHRPDPGPFPASPLLRRGSGGPGQAYWVRQVQHAVGVHADGIFGRQTGRAVWRYRKAHGLHPNGIVGPRVWAKIRNPGPPTTDRPDPIPQPKPKPIPHKITPAQVVDVSNNQGPVTWTPVRHAGVRAAIAKTSEGVDYRDSTWTSGRVREIRAAGLLLGTYHFLRPRPGRDARVEARLAVSAARAAGWSAKRDLPIGEDLEWSLLNGCQTADYGLRFAYEVRRLTGRFPLFYSYPAFLNAIPTSCRLELGKLGLWIAHYGVKTPIVPWPWSTHKAPGYTAWQYTSTATVPGIHTRVDMSLIAGGVPALRALAGTR